MPSREKRKLFSPKPQTFIFSRAPSHSFAPYFFPFPIRRSPLFPHLVHNVQACPRSPHYRGLQSCDGEISPMPCYRAVPGYVDIVLIHHLGVVRLIQTGPAAEAEPVHSRVPVCPPPQIGMSPAPRSLRGSHSYFGPTQVVDIGNSMALVSPRARSLALLRRPSLSPSQLVYFARLLEPFPPLPCAPTKHDC